MNLLALPAMAALLALAPACGPGAPETTGPTHGASGPPVTASGRAFVFGMAGGSLSGATVRVAEAPNLHTATDADGAFQLEVPSGGACSFVLHQDGFHDSQTATLPVGSSGLAQIGFQAPTEKTFSLLAAIIGIDPDPMRCQIATTVSRAGTDPYGGPGLGEPDATVTIDPPLPAESGPIYFRYVDTTLIYPDRKLTATTLDGGVLFANVPPGDYVMQASKPGARFTSVHLRCRPGVIVNAAPPWGIQEQ